MTPLEQIIFERTKKEGPITFEAFMEMALYYPDLGYYSSPETNIGKKGDFYTSPHLHPAFGAMIAKQLIEMWEFMGKPSEFNAVEIGAGSGYLCKDIFDYLNKPSDDPSLPEIKRAFLDSLKYIIVEPYGHFEKKQRALLKGGASEKVSWVKSLKELPAITGCIFSNELPDAFPVHLVQMEDELKEVYVTSEGGEFKEELSKISTGDLIDVISQFQLKLAPGYRTEINLQIKKWLKDITDVLSEGFLLTIDYGYTAREYYSDDRTKGTLLCYHKHLFNELPYQHIGEQDITAHINFSSLKKWGEELGLKTIGYCPQGTYLISLGIDKVITELYAGSPDYLGEISKIKGLIMPQGMGESHSVMVQYKGERLPGLRGFEMRNQVDSL